MSLKRKSKVPLESFRSSTSRFRSEEELLLNIRTNYTDDPLEVFNRQLVEDIPDDLKILLLENYRGGDIIEYKADTNDGLNKIQRKFIQRLKLVMINNNPDSTESHNERYIDDFIGFLLDVTGFDDGMDLTLRPCSLSLEIGEHTFAAIADKEGRRGAELTWIILEDKHGDIQLSYALIAASQLNYNRLERVYPEKIMGIKIVADKFYFCSMVIDQGYLDELKDGLPDSQTVLNLYPKLGYKIRHIEDRKMVLKCLETMKTEGLLLEKL